MTGLTEQERDSLTECECGHFANEHGDGGCLATDFSEADDRPVRDDDVCPCTHSPAAITRHAVERIKADAEAAARDMRAKIEALAERAAANARMMRARGREGKTPLHKMDGREGNTWDVIAHDLRALLADLGGEPQ